MCKEALAQCAAFVKLFAHVNVEDLLKKTRGLQEHSFPRQILIAGLVSELGFSKEVVGLAIGRDPSTIDHACRVVEALRGGLETVDVIEALGEEGVRDYLDGSQLVCAYEVLPKRASEKVARRRVVAVISGGEAVEEYIEHCEQLVDDLFAAFELVAVRGPAYRQKVAELKAEREAQQE